MRNAFRIMRMLAIGAFVACAASVASAQGEAQAASTPSAGGSFFEAFFISRVTQANGEQTLDIFGSILLWILLLLSMLSIGLMGMLAMTNQRKAYVPAGVVDQVRKMMKTGRFREALDLTGADESY